MKNKNIVFIRFLAIVLVMLGHSIIIYSNDWNIYTTANQSEFLNEIKQVINIIQMPIWFCISGFLFYSSTKKNDFRKLLKNKVYRLLIPFVIIGLSYLFPIRYIIKYKNYIQHSLIYNIIVNLIIGKDNGHLWYLPTLFFTFIFSYFFLKIKEKIKINDYIYIILIAVVGVFGTRIPLYLGNMFRYLVYFNIGYIMNKNKIKIKNKYLIISILLLPLITMLPQFNIANTVILNNIFAITFCIALFSCDFKLDNKVVNYISNNSYALYLLHSPLVYITYTYFPNIHPIYMIGINFIGFGLVCIIINEIVKKTKIKFVLGH